MQISNVSSVVFSATGSTELIVRRIADGVAARADVPVADRFDITREAKQVKRPFTADELVVIGVPSYGGRVPAPAASKIAACKGNGAPAVLVVSYGNRDIDDALAELFDLAVEAGFEPIAAGAFVAQHSIFNAVAAGRPDADDLAEIDAFAGRVADKASSDCAALVATDVPGNRPYREFGGVPFVPQVSGGCNECGRCALECPVGAISIDNPKATDAQKCIACMRCVKACPLGGRSVKGLKFKIAGWSFRRKCAERKGSLTFL